MSKEWVIMEMKIVAEHRRTLIHMLRSGKTLHEAAVELGRPLSWCYKWKGRYEQEGWSGLEERSKVPRRVNRKTPEKLRMEILRIRSELEAEAQGKEELGYIGGDAIYGRLR